MDDNIRYDDYLEDIAEDLLYSLESTDLPFVLDGRKLHCVLITYIFDDYSTEVTQIDY